jgi:LPS O-antigen subunit length determinant protein (WzzB/FepE family)
LESANDREIDLLAIVATLWKGRWTILVTMLFALVVGIVLYAVVPRSYESVATIFPLRQSQYAGYIELATSTALPSAGENQNEQDAGVKAAFPYSRDDLFKEFTRYLQNPAHLLEIAEQSKILKAGKNAPGQDDALAFVRSIVFAEPTEKNPGFTMRVRAENREALGNFVSSSLKQASVDLAQSLKAAVLSRIATGQKQIDNSIAQLQVEIASRRTKENKVRQDQILGLSEQLKTAQALGIQNPIALQSLDSQQRQPTAGASAQIISGNQPIYFQGAKALQERIDQLKGRKDVDAFTPELRNLQRQVYVLQHDTRTQYLRTALDESPLHDPAAAHLVEYSILGASPRKVFPNASTFGGGSLLIGMLLGCGIVLLRSGARRA